MKTCHVFGAGDFFAADVKITDGDVVFAADAGLENALSMNILPQLVIGDFDSFNGTLPQTEIIRLNCEKDETDMFECVRAGIAKGFNSFRLYGATGGTRIDHTLANIQILSFLAEKNMQNEAYTETQVLCALCNGKKTFPAGMKGYISVIALSDSACVTLKGLKYPLTKKIVANTFALGVSNSFTGDECEISATGTVLIIFDKQ